MKKGKGLLATAFLRKNLVLRAINKTVVGSGYTYAKAKKKKSVITSSCSLFNSPEALIFKDVTSNLIYDA